MKSLLRPAAVVSSLTIFAAYVYLQGSGRSLTELWSPATAEAGAPSRTTAGPMSTPGPFSGDLDIPATKSVALPVKVYPPPSVASGGYSSGILPGSTAAPQWLPTPAANPVSSAFPNPGGMRVLAGSKSLPMPVQMAPQATITITPDAAQSRSGPIVLHGSKSSVLPVTVTPGYLPPAQAAGAPQPPFAPSTAPRMMMMSGSKSDVMPIQGAPQRSSDANQQGYLPQQSTSTPSKTPQYPLFQGVPVAVPAGNVQQK